MCPAHCAGAVDHAHAAAVLRAAVTTHLAFTLEALEATGSPLLEERFGGHAGKEGKDHRERAACLVQQIRKRGSDPSAGTRPGGDQTLWTVVSSANELRTGSRHALSR